MFLVKSTDAIVAALSQPTNQPWTNDPDNKGRQPLIGPPQAQALPGYHQVQKRLPLSSLELKADTKGHGFLAFMGPSSTTAFLNEYSSNSVFYGKHLCPYSNLQCTVS